jgi:hypothetical protein
LSIGVFGKINRQNFLKKNHDSLSNPITLPIDRKPQRDIPFGSDLLSAKLRPVALEMNSKSQGFAAEVDG